jgi:hypothetical protein
MVMFNKNQNTSNFSHCLSFLKISFQFMFSSVFSSAYITEIFYKTTRVFGLVNFLYILKVL